MSLWNPSLGVIGGYETVTLTDPLHIAWYREMMAAAEAQWRAEQADAAIPRLRAVSAADAARALTIDTYRRILEDGTRTPAEHIWAQQQLFSLEGNHAGMTFLAVTTLIDMLPAAGARDTRSIGTRITSLPSNARSGGLSNSDRIRIQSFADRYGIDVHVVGSRASGTAGPMSDYDYILGESGGTSRLRQKARRELPRGIAGGEVHPSRGETGIDLFKDLLDQSRPHITFYSTQPGGNP